jgi:hypothetical protein
MIYHPMDDDRDLVEDVFDQENDLKNINKLILSNILEGKSTNQ